ncbi:MAG: methylhydantoinase [Gammaproteobacteria bacterium]|nr:methylhydantoinase [Gammaproteobacteria bacterium]
MTSVRIGIDVGGTFTDLVLAHAGRNTVYTGKLLTTPQDPAAAIIAGTQRLLREANVAPAEVTGIIHGTTLVTNTVIERTGARVGLITTTGFRDAIEMGKEIRYDLYDLFIEPVPALVPRHRRIGVGGRVDAQGQEVERLDEAAVAAAAKLLREEYAVDAIAVSFIHAYRNRAHEQAAAAIIAKLYPDLPVTLSSDVAPEIREFERTSTAIANAYVQPMMQGYLVRLEQQLLQLGIHGSLHIMLSGGGIATVQQACQFPIRLIESGPAAGAMAAAHFSAQLGEPDLISFDMGGTTAKMCLIENGLPRRAREFEAGRIRRFKKGSGIPLKITVVDMIEIGAGGGSIGHIDNMGLLKVGPRSAGSEPGPICYGRGGTNPAVTDADVVLGLLNPAYFLGGEMTLADNNLAQELESQLGHQLGLDTSRLAGGIHDIVNENMAAATRRYMAEKGQDPRKYSLIAFGGAGPVHVYGLAKKLKVGRFIVPYAAGVTSALGFLVAPPAVDEVRSFVARTSSLDVERVSPIIREMEAAARKQLAEAGAKDEHIHFLLSADMRYVGQGFEIEVPISDVTFDDNFAASLTQAFTATYQNLFGRLVSGVGVEVLSWRLHARAVAPTLDYAFDNEGSSADSEKGSREIMLPDFGTVMATVYDRYALGAGVEFSGPAIVEERESTTIVGPDCEVRVDSQLNLIVTIQPEQQDA